jgi:hypothetical protein
MPHGLRDNDISYGLTAFPPRLARSMHRTFPSRGHAPQRGEYSWESNARVARLELGGISRDERCGRRAAA